MKQVRRYLSKRGRIYYCLQRMSDKQKWLSLKTSDTKKARELALK
jgi:hypothetical protein